MSSPLAVARAYTDLSLFTARPEIAGEAGLLVPPGDVAALENALEKLLSDPGERERRSRLGLEHARQFTWERNARATLKVYEQANQLLQ